MCVTSNPVHIFSEESSPVFSVVDSQLSVHRIAAWETSLCCPPGFLSSYQDCVMLIGLCF